ncbi:MAG: hypothetical protein ACR2K6_04760 [Solirubrobacterales bacterium]
MPWYLSPRKIWRTAQGVRDVYRGGGPARISLDGIGGPEGWILPSLPLDLDVVARDGRTVALDPELPLPPLWGIGWKLARVAGVPVIGTFDPGRIRLDLPLPQVPVLSSRPDQSSAPRADG